MAPGGEVGVGPPPPPGGGGGGAGGSIGTAPQLLSGWQVYDLLELSYLQLNPGAQHDPGSQSIPTDLTSRTT